MHPTPALNRNLKISARLALPAAFLVLLAPIACTHVTPGPAAADATPGSAAAAPAPLPAAGAAGSPTVQTGGSPVRAPANDYYTQVYKIPTAAEVTEVLQRVRGYLDVSTASRILDRGGQRLLTPRGRFRARHLSRSRAVARGQFVFRPSLTNKVWSIPGC